MAWRPVWRKKLAAGKTLAKPKFFVVEAAPLKKWWSVVVAVGYECFMSTALRVGGVAALALVPVAVVLTVWLLRQG